MPIFLRGDALGRSGSGLGGLCARSPPGQSRIGNSKDAGMIAGVGALIS